MFKVNNQMVENFKGFQMKQSPYHIDRSSKKQHLSFRIEEKAVEDLKKHFKTTSDDVLSEGLRKLCFKELDNLCLEKKTFNNLECFMLIPKTDDVFELNNKSQIVAIANTEADFNENYTHTTPFNDDYNLTYELIDFESKYFINEMKILQNTQESCVFNTSKNDLRHFETFKDRQRALYSEDNDIFNLNVDDCYFVRFPLNNYLDKFIDGQFQHEAYSENHIGIYVLNDVVRGRKLFLIIDWYYLSEYEVQLRIDIDFASYEKLNHHIMNAKDDKLVEALKEAMSDKFMKDRLIVLKGQLERNLITINEMIDKCED